MIRPTALALLVLLSLAAAPASAQGTGGSPALVKYGKWVLAAGAVGMNYLAARAHNRANDRFELLETRCFADRSLCDLESAGRYANGETELLYQESLRYDRQTRRWLVGGETALLGAAAMFVWELTRRTPKPDNIPFEPEVSTHPDGVTRVGIRVAF
ncbi:MAG: hypothetical protein M3Q93_01520 [Gemmatimonadota bacterium]|nr:hypothetical protein [Gemmatimonadota bacterium]